MQTTNNKTALSKKIYSLCEAVAYITNIATGAEHYSGDSCADLASYIDWAQEFEAKTKGVIWGVTEDREFFDEIYTFTINKVRESNENHHRDNAYLIAKCFGEQLFKAIGAAKVVEVNELNKTPDYQNGACASHNYCDANQVLIDAMTDFNGKPYEYTQLDNSLIETVWKIARSNAFFIKSHI